MLFRDTNKLTVVFTLIAIACIVIMFLLGFWQLDRKYEKEGRLAQIEQRQTANPLSVTDVANNPDDYIDFPMFVTGDMGNQTFFIDNRLKNGMVGYEVLVPVATNYGIVMVNLGWIPSRGLRAELPELRLPTTNEFQGILYVPKDNVMVSETNFDYGRFPVLIQQIDFIEIEKHLGRDVLPFTVRLMPDENSTFIRDWQVVVMAPERHLGYAIQWFGLGIAALTVFLLTILKSMQGRQD